MRRLIWSVAILAAAAELVAAALMRGGRLIYVNEQACRVLGYARDQLLAMTIHDINPNYPPEVWKTHWADLRRRKHFSVESFHRARDGRVIPVERHGAFAQAIA